MSSEFDYYGNAKSIYRIDALTKNNNGISELEYKFKKSSIIFIFFFALVILCLTIIVFYLPIPRKMSLYGETYHSDISVYKAPVAGFVHFNDEKIGRSESVLFTISKKTGKFFFERKENIIESLYKERLGILEENISLIVKQIVSDLELKKKKIRLLSNKIENLELQREKLKSMVISFKEIYRINYEAERFGATSKAELANSKARYADSELQILKLVNDLEELRLSKKIANSEVFNLEKRLELERNNYKLLSKDVQFDIQSYIENNYFSQKLQKNGDFYKSPFLNSDSFVNENDIIGYSINNDSQVIVRSQAKLESSHFLPIGSEAIFKIRDKQNARDIVIQGELLDIISLTVFNENIKESESLGNEAILQFSVTNQDIIGHVPLGTPVEINIKLPEKTIFNRLFPYEKS